MANCKKGNGIFRKIYAELSRIDARCMAVGAILTLAVGFLSSLVSGSNRLPEELRQPPGSPPAILFPIIWTFLYVLIGAAAGAVACSRERALEPVRMRGLFLYGLGLLLNFVWSPLFFGSGAYLLAFIDIVAMIIVAVMTLLCFARIYLVSAAAMGIYIVWLVYAGYLNLGIMILN